MATHKTGTDISAAARVAKLRLLYRHASMRVEAMLEAPRAPLALRAPALRVLARLTAHKPAARAATNAKQRVAQLRALISALTRLITHIEGQPRGARGAAELRKLRTQAQSLLAKELQVPPKGAAPRPAARKTGRATTSRATSA